jgi:hypothetical protein
MSVVLRCTNCGTTKATPGQCEACHEAQVRYFCTSHTPGLWLATGTCPTCGARFGAATRPPAPPPPKPAVPVRAHPRSRTPASTPERSPAPSRPERLRAAAGFSSSRERLRPVDEAEIAAAGPPPMALWQKLLGAAIRARYMPTRDAPGLARLPIGSSAAGCLKRLLLLGLLVFFALLIALFLFGRALLNGSSHLTKALEPAHSNAVLTARASTLVIEPFGVARPTA